MNKNEYIAAFTLINLYVDKYVRARARIITLQSKPRGHIIVFYGGTDLNHRIYLALEQRKAVARQLFSMNRQKTETESPRKSSGTAKVQVSLRDGNFAKSSRPRYVPPTKTAYNKIARARARTE